MFTDNLLLQLVGELYAATDDTAAWPPLLERIGDAFGGAACGFTVNDFNAGRTKVAASVRLDPDCVRAYHAHYHKLDLFTSRGFSFCTDRHAVPSHAYLRDEELARSQYFNEFLRKQDLFYNLGAAVSVGATTTGFFSILRARKSGPFTENEGRALDVLAPHLGRAVKLHGKLLHTFSCEQILDSLPTGIVTAEASGKVVFMNRAASAILKENDGMRLTPAGLLSAPGALGRKLLDLCSVQRQTPHSESLSVPRLSGKRPYLVSVSTLRSSHLALAFGGAAVLLMITDTDKHFDFDRDSLRVLFGLTPAELRLTLLLCAGEDLTEASDELSISRNTARAHLRAIFEKTGVRRQSELMSLVSRLAVVNRRA